MMKSADPSIVACESLPEVREDEASGDIARIYSDIRAVQKLSTVNYIWRHLASIDGALQGAWPTAKRLAPAISRTARGLAIRASLLVEPWKAELSSIRPGDEEMQSILRFYNHGNAWNLSAISFLLGAPEQPNNEPPSLSRHEATIGSFPKLPRFADLPNSIQDVVQQLSSSGPAADTGIRPSLWVHLALWPQHLIALSGPVEAMIGSEQFRGAHRQLLAACGVAYSEPSSSKAAEANARDSLQKFRRRIAEMLLVGHAIAPQES